MRGWQWGGGSEEVMTAQLQALVDLQGDVAKLKCILGTLIGWLTYSVLRPEEVEALHKMLEEINARDK